MAGKKLEELSMSELTTELDRASIIGTFSEAEAVIRLTVYLVKSKENPFSFKFFPCDIPAADDVPKEDGEGPTDVSEDMVISCDLPITVDEPREAVEDNGWCSVPCEEPLAHDDQVEDILAPDYPQSDVAADLARAAKEGNEVAFTTSEGLSDMISRGIGVSRGELVDVRSLYFMEETQHGGKPSNITLLLKSHLSSNVADTIRVKVQNLCSNQTKICRHSIWPPDFVEKSVPVVALV